MRLVSTQVTKTLILKKKLAEQGKISLVRTVALVKGRLTMLLVRAAVGEAQTATLAGQVVVLAAVEVPPPPVLAHRDSLALAVRVLEVALAQVQGRGSPAAVITAVAVAVAVVAAALVLRKVQHPRLLQYPSK
jgi:hypothetical protein